MMSDPPANQFIPELFRYACVLAENESEAGEAVAKALQVCRGKHVAPDTPRFRRFAAASIWRQLVPRGKRNQTPHRKPSYSNGIADGAAGLAAGLPVEIVFEELRKLPEPGRSALVLLYLGIFEVSDLESILDTPTSELSVAMMLAREDLSLALQRREAIA